MIINFNFKNYRSFRDSHSFSMEAASIRELKESIQVRRGYNILSVAVFYGANSSGKSNALRAFQTMRSLVLQSVKLNPGDKLHYEPFELDENSANCPTMFEVQFIQDNVVYRYGFEYDSRMIYKEWLFEKLEGQREYNLFARAESDFDISDKRFPEGKGKESSTETNRLFISLVAQLKGDKSKAILNWFNNCSYLAGLNSYGYEGFTTEMLKNHEDGYRWAMEFFNHLQLGFNDIKISEKKLTDYSEIWNRQQSEAKDRYKDETVVETVTLHNIYDDAGNVTGQKSFLKDVQESEGTKKIIEMSGPIFDTLSNGKVLLVDELEAKLHPLLTISIVKLFINKDTNPKGAQLIFTTHDTHLLNLNILRRDMIWFTEKDNKESTDIYSLVEFKDKNGTKVRNDRSIEKDYINGRYGAIPFMK